ncbi:MAG: hypothetical protein KUG80_07965 [Gammaproteobacteria bacterium]|nr:hypothetical protein [Gammaproteobacteria bacterium]
MGGGFDGVLDAEAEFTLKYIVIAIKSRLGSLQVFLTVSLEPVKDKPGEIR